MMPFELAEPYTLRDAARLIDADDPSVRAIAAHVVVRMEPKVPQRSSHKPASRPGNKGGGYAGRGAGQCGTLEPSLPVALPLRVASPSARIRRFAGANRESDICVKNH